MSLLDLPIYPWWWKGKPCNRDLAWRLPLHATKNYRSDHGVTVLDRIRSLWAVRRCDRGQRTPGCSCGHVHTSAAASTSCRPLHLETCAAAAATCDRLTNTSKLEIECEEHGKHTLRERLGLRRAPSRGVAAPRPRRAQSGRACVWYDIAAGQVRHANSQVCDGVTTRHRPKWCERDRAREADLNNHFRTSTWRVEARSSWAEVLHTA
jgi:hypothetical protein